MHRHFPVLVLILWAFQGFSQGYDPLHAPNTYQAHDNPHYWQNKKPFEGYWQQDVHYTLKANIDEATDIIDGKEKLVYTNNSPDTLTFVFFHLYQQAFQPGSYYDNLQHHNHQRPEYGNYERDGLGTKVSNVKVNGTTVEPSFDNTIMRIELPTPLAPNSSIELEMDFKTYFQAGTDMGRRMKTFDAWGNKHYDGVHWYPRIAVYDRKFGWTSDQHLSREFYGDFGAFDVELTFSSNFIVEATGNLVNRDEMLPADLRAKLDIRNFKQKRWNDKPTEIIPYDPKQRKTWTFHAENVHDFAFSADPTYRIGEAEWNGIKCYAMAQEPHAAAWQNAAEYTAKIIQTFSEDIGMYTYHKMVVCDARDGMEYPMITLDGGWDPQYRSLLVHEVGHNWFFGQIGTNETYRAFMDEGFTQFLTVWGLEAIDGDTLVMPKWGGKYHKKYSKDQLAMNEEIYYGYMRDAVKGHDPPLNTHSDQFNGALGQGGGYGHVYYKTAAMLYNLQYVLGDELFLKSMQHYFNQWKIAHPYPEDFRNSIIQYSDVDLNWFFDQWLETTKRIDYGVKKVRKGDAENEYVITFERNGEMQMPLDFTVKARDGKSYDYHIPNTWFVKKTGATVLPKWTGWDKLHPTYEAHVIIPEGIDNVQIDPTNRLADSYMLNNSKKTPINYSFDSHIYNTPDWRSYEVNARPELWWNGYDGFKPGLHINGNYLNHKHIFDATVWLNTGLAQNLHPEFVNDDNVNNEFDDFSYRFNYRNGIERLSKNTYYDLHASKMAGLEIYKVGLDKTANNGKTKLYTFFKSMIRKDSADLVYLLYPEQWQVRKYNNTFNFGVDHRYKYARGKGHINLNLRSSTVGGDYDYAQISMTVINRNRVGKLKVNTRAFALFGTGTNTPDESALYLAGGNPEQMMDSKYTRATGFWDHAFARYDRTTDHFNVGGGLGLRGYSGYLATFVDDNDSLRFVHKGQSGASANIEIELQNLINWKPRKLSRMFKLEYYLFGDAGVITANLPDEDPILSDIRMDGGFGMALTIKRWGSLYKIKPLTVRFDMPFVLNRPPFREGDYAQMRWVLGINRAF